MAPPLAPLADSYFPSDLNFLAMLCWTTSSSRTATTAILT